MVMSQQDSGSVLRQSALNHNPRVDLRTINGTREQPFHGNQLMARIEKCHLKVLARLASQAKSKELPCHIRIIQERACGAHSLLKDPQCSSDSRLFTFVTPRHLAHMDNGFYLMHLNLLSLTA